MTLPLLDWKLLSPLYTAVTVWVPKARAESLMAAWPPFSATGTPKLLPSTTKRTVPPSSKLPEPGVTVAVKVSCWFVGEGFNDEVTAVVVVARPTTSPPERVPVLVWNLASPL